MLSTFWKNGCATLSIFWLLYAIGGTAQTPKTTVVGSTSSLKSTGSLTPSQIFSRSRGSVVVIIAADQTNKNEALGSGFIVSNNRIVTNHHVLEGMSQAVIVFSDGSVKSVSSVIADSAEQDLIVVTTQTGNRQPLPFGGELALQQGDSVYALGAPKGLELSFTIGIVSSFRKSNSQFLIQTTAPIAPGSSGGPLFNQAGKVVGVTRLLADAPGIYFNNHVTPSHSDLRRAPLSD
jgi:serine protease Do